MARLERACAVIPTLNNAGTVAAVVERAREHAQTVIVINDGSTDATADVLARFEGESTVRVVTHASNLGKGAALHRGLREAAEAGCTHAVTLDADGQHDPGEIPALLEAARTHPEALVVGARDLSGSGRRPRKSRLLRLHSNFWVWVETGHWGADTQSGFRVYPLQPLSNLSLNTTKYDFEIETLVKLLWNGTPVVSVPVRAYYGPGSESRFRPVADFALVARLNAKLVFQRLLLPRVARQALSRRPSGGGAGRWRAAWGARLRAERPSPGRFAASLGVGVCCGILPIWGFQLAAAVAVAHVLRLNKVLALIGGNVSFPAAIPFVLYASLLTGRAVLQSDASGLPALATLTPEMVWAFAREYLVGATVLAFGAGLATAAAAYGLARLSGGARRGTSA